MDKDGICWIIGGFFFFLSLMIAGMIGADPTVFGSMELQELAYVILFGLVGLAFVISGSIFHTQTNNHK